jgi:hypothetical protein
MPPRVVVCAEGPGGKPIREFREDTGEISVPGEKQQQQGPQGALYADQAPEAMKKQNLSKEMKQKLRQEYYGLGGAENKAMNGNYFLWIIVVISILAVLSKLTGAI